MKKLTQFLVVLLTVATLCTSVLPFFVSAEEVYSTHDMIVTEWMELANGTMGWVELYNESIELSN